MRMIETTRRKVVRMDLQLSGKRAIVTGGSRGIGLAAATALAAEGADVALAARGIQELDRARDAVARHGRRVLAIPTDTTDDASVQAFVAETVAEFGGVDILINAAARAATPGNPRLLADLRDEGLREEIETKVLGYLRTARAVAPYMVEQGWGRIVNVSGLAALQSGNTFGSMRNVAVAAMTKNLADELGPAGVNVTVVHPAITRTERTPALIEATAAARGISSAAADALLGGGSTIGRMVTAQEVADVIVFLASPRSVGVTGDAIPVGGGLPGVIRY